MDHDISQREVEALRVKKRVAFRLCNVSGQTSEVLEIRADDPKFHVLFIPGNPAVGHISQTKKNWEQGRLFSLQDQINHKMDFIQQELQNIAVLLLLVGHSIGSYISLEMFKRSPEKFAGILGHLLYRAISVFGFNPPTIDEAGCYSENCRVYHSVSVLELYCCAFGIVAYITSEVNCTHIPWEVMDSCCSWDCLLSLGKVPHLSECSIFGKVRIPKAFRNTRLRKNQQKIAFLFGSDDHWGPLQLSEEIAKQVPGAALSIEGEGHTHGFCCTEAGSVWVAEHVASLIKNKVSF